MAGYRAVGVLLAAAALLHAAAPASGSADDEHMFHLKCFKSCTSTCHAGGEQDAGRCKAGCLHECFEEVPALCYQQCVVKNCLCLPPYSKEKVTCMKKCCGKCFHHGPKPGPSPKPKPPSPPKHKPPPCSCPPGSKP